MHFGVDIIEVDAVSEASGQAQREHDASKAKTSCNGATRLRQLRVVGAHPK